MWRNEDGGPEAPDNIIDSLGSYVPREVEHEYFKSSTTEVRLLSNYNIANHEQTLAAGVRIFDGWMKRQEGGTGSTGIDANFTNYNPDNAYDNDLDFTTLNIAPFIENTFHIGNSLSITPGFRFEYIKSTATGHVTDDDGNIIPVNESKPRNIPLAGIAFQYKTSGTTNIYANITQAYTPISYSFLYPLGLDINAAIDPKLKDVNGYNADLGWRGNIKTWFTFDVSGFFMAHNNNIAIETITSGTDTSYYETNVGNAYHIGIESYEELNIVKLFTKHSRIGSISFFNSFSYDHATYVTGIFKGNQAEYAPKTIERFGITYALKGFSTTFLFSNTAKSFSDANNTTIESADAEVGVIPAYTIMDWSASLRIKNYNIKAGVNNLADAHYFTFRTIEYPGPGIIPSIGRTFYIGFGARF